MTYPSGPEAEITFRVQSRRVEESLVSALCDAYAQDRQLPEDMMAMLQKLNGQDKRSHR